MNARKLFAYVLMLTLAWTDSTWAQQDAPGKPMPGGDNNVDYFYVFGPRGRRSSGREDALQINFYRVSASYQGPVNIYIFDPGVSGSHDRRSRLWGGRTTTRFAVYGGAGAFTDKGAQTAAPTAKQAGTELVSRLFSSEHSDEWVALGPFSVDQGERVGGYVYFKLVVQGYDGKASNFFGTAVTPISAEAFSYNISAHLTAERGESMVFDVEVPAGTTEITEHNYDLDRGGVSYLATPTGRQPLRRSRTGDWTQTRVTNPRINAGHAEYTIVKGSQGYANAAFYFTDASGAALKIFMNSRLTPTPAPTVVPTAANECQINTRLITLTKRIPAEVALGKEFQMNGHVVCVQDATNIVVRDVVPDGATYVRSEPAATVEGQNLTWTLGEMSRGDSRDIAVWFKADREGELLACATVVALPKSCVTTRVGRPALSIAKTGPATALLGTTVSYDIVVQNTGTALARDVTVHDVIPDGLTHASGKRELDFQIGDLQPGQEKTLTVALRAARRGKMCNAATADATNTESVNDTACTVVQEPGLEVAKSGPPVQYLNKTASYKIVATNTGDTTLTNVVLIDNAPAACRIVAAKEGGRVDGNRASWTIAELAPGASVTRAVVLTTGVAGKHCNTVIATSGGLSARAEACTDWKGYPALLLEVIDTNDPLLIDETTQYRVRVTNQGTAPDTNVGIVARFPAEVTPVTASGATTGTVSGKVVNFKPYPSLAPKQAIEFTIDAKAAAVGDSRLKVEMSSDLLKSPVTEEESTHVY